MQLLKQSAVVRSYLVPILNNTDPLVLTQFNDLSIYNAGTLRTTFSGFTRVASVAGFFFGTFGIAPMFVFDSFLSTFWAPVIVLGSAIPMAIIPIIAAPFVSTIRLSLPKEARRSVEAVLQYARRLPPDTKVTFQTMRWFPWPVNNTIRFDELRRLPDGTSGSSNLIIQPAGELKARQRAELEISPLLARLMKRMYSRLYVNRQQAQDQSSAPGILDILWEQIPLSEEKSGEPASPLHEGKKARKPRTVPMAARRPSRPPPPPQYTRK